MEQRGKLKWVGCFAVGFAYVEAAVVVYLRQLYGISDLMLDIPPFDPALGLLEFGREISTLTILITVGWAVGRTLQARLGFAFFAFGVWDIFYYLWLKLFINWPASFLTSDILFLVPLPWWGPVIGPVLIAVLMIIAGVRAIIYDDHGSKIRFSIIQASILGIGILTVLYAFMADALAALPTSLEMLSQLRPAGFLWSVYALGFLLMAGSVLSTLLSRTTPD